MSDAENQEILFVESMDLDAQGVAQRPCGKVVFIEGALPGEEVSAQTRRRKNNWEAADLVSIHRASSQRVEPHCPHFGLHTGACGGCKMQHLHIGAQVAIKQRALEDNLWHLGKVRPGRILPAIEGAAWGYRHRARLAVRHVLKKAQVLVGFHERKSRYVADMTSCKVLPPHVDALLVPLRGLIASMDAIQTCPQIELACGRNKVTALVLRHLEPLSNADKDRLREFAREHGDLCRIQWWLQPKGPQSIHLLDAEQTASELAYELPEFGITMPFLPTDFTQVNPDINQVLVGRAVRLLDVQKHERVIDWFCGLGNFTLPLATRASEVLGIEGSSALVERSQQNYALNQSNRPKGHSALAPTSFTTRNLFEITPEDLLAIPSAEKWLVDPPREGAFALCKAMMDLHEAESPSRSWTPPQRIVYVSCNPATLARDAGLLVHQAGYRCTAAGVVNMFPHTAHVESIAVFEKESKKCHSQD